MHPTAFLQRLQRYKSKAGVVLTHFAFVEIYYRELFTQRGELRSGGTELHRYIVSWAAQVIVLDRTILFAALADIADRNSHDDAGELFFRFVELLAWVFHFCRVSSERAARDFALCRWISLGLLVSTWLRHFPFGERLLLLTQQLCLAQECFLRLVVLFVLCTLPAIAPARRWKRAGLIAVAIFLQLEVQLRPVFWVQQELPKFADVGIGSFINADQHDLLGHDLATDVDVDHGRHMHGAGHPLQVITNDLANLCLMPFRIGKTIQAMRFKDHIGQNAVQTRVHFTSKTGHHAVHDNQRSNA